MLDSEQQSSLVVSQEPSGEPRSETLQQLMTALQEWGASNPIPLLTAKAKEFLKGKELDLIALIRSPIQTPEIWIDVLQTQDFIQ